MTRDPHGHRHPGRIERLEPGDHLCCIYETDEEHRAVVTPYLRAGLERNEKVLYIVDARTAEQIEGYLRDDGLDPAPFLARGQLVLLTGDESYLKSGTFDPDGMIALLTEETDAALAAGYDALRVTGEMTWALRGRPGSERLIEYEAKLNQFFPGRRCLAICQYDRRRFDAGVLLDVLRTHPFAVVGTAIHDNFYYLEPEEMLGDDLDAATLRHWLTNLAAWQAREASLQASERLLDFAIAQLPVPVIIADAPDVSITHYNQRALELLAAPADPREIPLAAHREFWPTFHPDGTPYRVEDLPLTRAVQRGETTLDEEIIVRRADGDHHISVNAAPLKDAAGEILAGIVVFPEITERVRLEAERRELERQFQHAQKLESLGVLAGGIAHDFANILLAVLGNAALALEDLPPGSPVRPSLEQIERSARTASDLCKQMLAYSGKGQFVIRPIDVSQLVDDLGQMLRVSISKKAVLSPRLARDLPPVEGDLSQLTQVVMNLITNASDAIGERSGTISLRTGVQDCDASYLGESFLAEGPRPGRYVFLEVADTGGGMDEATRARIFDPFFTTKFQGRGLGLAAVLGIVRGHRGTIKVYSEPGKGTSVKVLLPVAEGAAETPTARRTRTPPSNRGRGLILLADDEAPVRDLGRQILERAGYVVILAEDGRAALEVFRSLAEEITCVVLDLTMPHLDGEQVFRELRTLKPDVPVLLSSGYNSADVARDLVGRGLAGFVQKPYQPRELRAAVARAVGAEAGERST